MAVTLLVIRHGEAEGNHDHRFIGQSDVPLSDLGRRQADTVGAYLASKGVTRIISSDLQRAVNTARPLADRIGLDIEIDVRLREILNGDWAMHLPEEIEAGWPDLWRRYRSGEDVQRPNGETWGAVGVPRPRGARGVGRDRRWNDRRLLPRGSHPVGGLLGHGRPAGHQPLPRAAPSSCQRLDHIDRRPRAQVAELQRDGAPSPDLAPESNLLPFLK